MLTYDEFLKIKPGSNFAQGEIINSPDGLYMTGSDKMLKWVAVKGYANDWCIYTHFADNSYDYVKNYGDKVCSEDNIKRVVPCDNKTFWCYRY